MSSPEEQQVALIPRNFMERGTFMGGMFKIRNAIEGAVLAVGIGYPVVHLPVSLTARIIILCMTSLPAAMVSLIGIGEESLTAFLMNALRFLKNRRMIYRSDVMPDHRRKWQYPRNREPKSQKRKKSKGNQHNNRTRDCVNPTNNNNPDLRQMENLSQQADETDDANMEQDQKNPSSRKVRKQEAKRQKAEKKLERRLYDTSTSHGIKKQAKEDIRVLKAERCTDHIYPKGQRRHR